MAPRARPAPSFLAAAGPEFSASATTGMPMRAATDGVSSVESSSMTMISASGVIAGIVVDRNDDRDANLGAGLAAHGLPQRPPSGICHCDPLGSEGVPPALAPDQGTSQSLSGPRWPGLEY